MNSTLNKGIFSKKRIDLLVTFVKTQWIATLILIMILFLSVSFLRVTNYTQTDSIYLTSDNFNNYSSNLYIDSDTSVDFGDTTSFNGREIPKILNTPITAVWKPLQYPVNKTVTVKAEVSNNMDLAFQVNCKPCEGTQQTTENSFFLTKLSSYSNMLDFNNIFLYSKNSLSAANQSENIVTWLKENVPEGSTVESINDSLPLNQITNTKVVSHNDSIISNKVNLIGSHEFYLYLKDSFTMQIGLSDNDYRNILDDTASVYLYDTRGNIVYSNSTKLARRGNPLSESLIDTYELKDLPKEGVYRLSIVIPDTTIIKTIGVNTDKIVVSQKVSLKEALPLYTKVTSRKPVFIMAANFNGIADVSIENTKTGQSFPDIAITNEHLGNENEHYLEKGNYKIGLTGGQTIRGGLFAFSKDQYFDPFIYDLTNTEDPTYVVSNFKQTPTKNGFSEVTYILNNSDLNRLLSLQRIEFLFSSLDLNRQFKDNQLRDSRFYEQSKSLGDYRIFTKTAENKAVQGAADSTRSIVEAVKETLPKHSKILFQTSESFYQDLFIDDAPSVKPDSSKTTHLDLNILGDHQFYVIAQGDLNINFRVRPYFAEQIIQVQLRNADGALVCQHGFPADGGNSLILKTTCDNLQLGTYVLRIRSIRSETLGTRGSFEVLSLDINTDKILIKDYVRLLTPKILYTDIPYDYDVTFLSFDNLNNVSIAQEKGKVTATQETSDEGQELTKTFAPGEKEYIIQQKGIMIKAPYLAVERSSLFIPYSHYTINNIDLNPDYIITDAQNDNFIYIKKLEIDVD